MSEEKRIEVFRPRDRAIEGVESGTTPILSPFRYEHKGLDLAACWGTARKHRRVSLAIFLAVFVGVALWTFLQKPTYRARTLLEIENQDPNVVTAQDLFGLDTVTDVYLETQYKVLESDSLAQQVIDELHLASIPELNPDPRPFWSRWLSKPRSIEAKAADPAKILNNFRTRLEITPIRRSRLVEITFDSHDPKLAANVLNAFATAYIDHNVQTRRDESQNVATLLSSELATANRKLKESQDAVRTYALANNLVFLDEPAGGNETLVTQRLQKLQDDLTAAEADRNQKESLYHLVQSGDASSIPGVFDNKLIQDLSVQLAELQKQYAQLSTTFSPTYYKVKEVQSQVQELQNALDRERKRAVERISKENTAAIERENLAQKRLASERKQADLVAERLVQYNELSAEVENNKKLHDDLSQRVKQASISAKLTSSKVRVVDAAQPPSVPVEPRVAINLALGAFIGLVLGVGVGFLRESTDRTFRNPEEVRNLLSLPTLGSVPTIHALSDRAYTYRPVPLLPARGAPPVVTLFRDSTAEISSPAARTILAESFRGLATSMLLSGDSRPPASILISSTRPAEGKTMVATNLAIALSELGQRVLLIDADMRRPKIHSALGMTAQSGLSAYLAGEVGWREVVQRTGIIDLDVLLCGAPSSNPIQLLSSDRLRILLKEAVKQYKCVLIDSPPLLNVADARILARMVEGVILVVKAGATPHILVQRAESYIRAADAVITGVVLNNFSDEPYTQYSSPLYYSSAS